MFVEFTEAPVAYPFISVDGASRLDVRNDDSLQGLCFRVFDNMKPSRSTPLHHAENGRLCLDASTPGIRSLLVLVLPFVFAANKKFVVLGLAFQEFGYFVFQHPPYPVEHVPCVLLLNTDVFRQLAGRDTFLVRGAKPDRNEPLLERGLRVLEHGSDQHRELLTARRALVSTVLQRVYFLCVSA